MTPRSVVAGVASAALITLPATASAEPALDVTHYRISVDVNPSSGRLTGHTTLTATAGSSVTLQLALGADDVRVNDQPVAFTQRGLNLTFGNPTPGQVRIAIDYHGTPARTRVDGLNPWMWTATEQVAAGEPRIAPWWFPCNDTPSDKATYDIIGRVPAGQQFISNGRLVAREGRRWHWRNPEPMATYLTVMAAGRYTGSRGLRYAVAQGLPRDNLRLLKLTGTYIDWLATQLGPYPFASRGGLVTGTFKNENWSMETQTRPTYPDLTGLSDQPELMVHELAHQWFGDSVTPQRWRDIWLNEGFARWMELRYQETHGGRAASTWLASNYPRHGRAFWAVPIGSPARADLLSWAVYDRGAMAVQALRQRIGDPAFFTLLQRWTATYWHGNATVEDFQRMAAEVSGQDLNSFFQAWLFTPGRPAATAENGIADL
jgi:aminopeptidase N